jgi:hypothetical protein
MRDGTCYVNLGQAPNTIYNSYLKRNYDRANLKKLGYNRFIRMGAYGDPAAIPITIWDDLLSTASGWTGYTHSGLSQPTLRRYAHASVETEDQAKEYQALGWKTFRVKRSSEPLAAGEILCPSTKGIQCIQCLKCQGTNGQNITIDIHGAQWKQDRYSAERNSREAYSEDDQRAT